MSVELWAYDDIKCDGYECLESCDSCPIKDEKRCEECAYYQGPITPLGFYGYCELDDMAISPVHKACAEFEEADE